MNVVKIIHGLVCVVVYVRPYKHVNTRFSYM